MIDPQQLFNQLGSLDTKQIAWNLASQWGPPSGGMGMGAGAGAGTGGGFASFLLPQMNAGGAPAGTPTSSGGIPGAATPAPVVSPMVNPSAGNGLNLGDAQRAELLKYWTNNQPGSFANTASIWSSGRPLMDAGTANLYRTILGL